MISRLHVCALVLLVPLAFSGCRRGTDSASEGTAEGSTAAESQGSGQEPTPEEASAGPEAAPATPPNRTPVVRSQANSADRELATRLGLAPPEPLRVADLLTHADIRELMQYTGDLTIATLDGLEPGPHYNALRLSAASGFGFAVQLWQEDEQRQALSRFARLQETYIDRNLDTAPVGDEAFWGEFEGIRHYAFFHRASKSVVIVSCQAELCTPDQVRAMADRIMSRL